MKQIRINIFTTFIVIVLLAILGMISRVYLAEMTIFLIVILLAARACLLSVMFIWEFSYINLKLFTYLIIPEALCFELLCNLIKNWIEDDIVTQKDITEKSSSTRTIYEVQWESRYGSFSSEVEPAYKVFYSEKEADEFKEKLKEANTLLQHTNCPRIVINKKEA